jgi:hypothetical protein
MKVTMKLSLSLLLFFLCFILNGQDFKKLDEKNVDPKQKEFSRKFAAGYFSKQISGGWYQFKNDEATDEIIKFLTPEKQKEVYNQLKSTFGAFKSLEYSQTWFESNSKLVIYRFKSQFGDSNKLEIRVVLNDKGKISGFFVKPWTENLQ